MAKQFPWDSRCFRPENNAKFGRVIGVIVVVKDCFSIEKSCRWSLVFVWGLFVAPGASLAQPQAAFDTFMVIDRGTALIGADGIEIVRLSKTAHATGALSPDGQWVVFVDSSSIDTGETLASRVVIQSRRNPVDQISVPMIWGRSGSSFQAMWAPNSQRVLICEQGRRNQGRTSAFRIYDLTTKSLVELECSLDQIPTEWSADGKRLLTSVDGRIAWVNMDGTGEPEFITSHFEAAFGAQLSPDGKRLLCMAGFRRPNEDRQPLRLSVVDMETKKRSFVDDPGEVQGYCWSPDGSRIAYTWQPTPEDSDETPFRETFLITCDVDGGHRKTVTSRKYDVSKVGLGRGETTIFFQVIAWR
ncbi:WD40 repeat domain-containing protein [Schlesneria paludicola]|uniref:WD40 repeat domain-containing protein n=1 Tax=Schlesneria paludicola TaxID=360056 RepID=UPI00029AD56D|nr:PD40 domain-containing protein [Schlesneria paludicola]